MLIKKCIEAISGPIRKDAISEISHAFLFLDEVMQHKKIKSHKCNLFIKGSVLKNTFMELKFDLDFYITTSDTEKAIQAFRKALPETLEIFNDKIKKRNTTKPLKEPLVKIDRIAFLEVVIRGFHQILGISFLLKKRGIKVDQNRGIIIQTVFIENLLTEVQNKDDNKSRYSPIISNKLSQVRLNYVKQELKKKKITNLVRFIKLLHYQMWWKCFNEEIPKIPSYLIELIAIRTDTCKNLDTFVKSVLKNLNNLSKNKSSIYDPVYPLCKVYLKFSLLEKYNIFYEYILANYSLCIKNTWDLTRKKVKGYKSKKLTKYEKKQKKRLFEKYKLNFSLIFNENLKLSFPI